MNRARTRPMLDRPSSVHDFVRSPQTGGSLTMDHRHASPNHEAVKGDASLRDPVCGMVVTLKSGHRFDHEGVTYYFCRTRCEEKFRATPMQYVAREAKWREPGHPHGGHIPTSDAAVYVCPMHPEVRQSGPGACPKCGMALERETPVLAPTRTQYTCPMHPEIVRDEPGECPICGMALEPMTVTVEDEESPELTDMTRRFWVSAGADGAARHRRHGRVRGAQLRVAGNAEGAQLARAGAGHASGAVGRLDVFRAWLAVGRQSQPQYVHPHWAWHRGSLRVQRRRDRFAGDLPGIVSRRPRRGRDLLRSGRGHRNPGAARAGDGAARAPAHRRRHQSTAGTRAEDGPAHRD